MKTISLYLAAILTGAALMTETAHATDSDWPQWRGPHLDGGGRQDFEVEPGWRECFQVSRIGEEREHLMTRAWKPKLRVEGKLFHLGTRSELGLDAARPECAPTAGGLEQPDDAGHTKDDTQPDRNAESKPRSDKQCERGEAAQDPAFGTDVR
jgi:hypothetical protein